MSSARFSISDAEPLDMLQEIWLITNSQIYSFLSRRTNAYIYIYINNILYILNTPTCFDVSASSSGSLILPLCYSYENY